MRTRKTYLMISTILLIGLIFTGTPFSDDEWRKGTVTEVRKNTVKVDNRTYLINDSVIIKDVSGDILPSDADYLRGADEVLYKIENGVLKEIRIFRRME